MNRKIVRRRRGSGSPYDVAVVDVGLIGEVELRFVADTQLIVYGFCNCGGNYRSRAVEKPKKILAMPDLLAG